MRWKDCQAPATESQIQKLEIYWKHPLPLYLREIFKHYNGGRPCLRKFDDESGSYGSISYFYVLNENKQDQFNVWNIIKNYAEFMGKNAIPFAQDSDGSIYFLRWKKNQAKVMALETGEIALESFDSDEYEAWDGHSFPTYLVNVMDSFEQFLEGLYEPVN